MNNKKKLIIISILALLAISLLILSNRPFDKKEPGEYFFIEALKENSVSQCSQIPESLKISGKEIHSLIEDNDYDDRTNFLPNEKGYSMQDACKTLIDLSREAQAQFPKEQNTKGECGVNVLGDNYNPDNCSAQCDEKSDCQYTCGCGAINKDESCFDDGAIYKCINTGVDCIDNECIITEEMI